MQKHCYSCGAALESSALVCLCGGTLFFANRARPDRVHSAPTIDLPFPWSAVVESWPEGSLIGLYGPPGSGKSSLAALLRPCAWFTSEQTISQASALLQRLQGKDYEPTEIRTLSDPEAVKSALADYHQGLVVLDSVTRCGSVNQQLEAMEAIHRWTTAEPDRRALAILQVTKRGEMAGLRELEHLTDAIAGVAVEESGLRRLEASKNRNGGLGTAYFKLGKEGVIKPSFDYSYSVEGSPGAYALMPWPSPGAKWAGLLDREFLEGARPGLASAGRFVAGYPGDKLLPADAEDRKKFALAHGLKWLD